MRCIVDPDRGRPVNLDEDMTAAPIVDPYHYGAEDGQSPEMAETGVGMGGYNTSGGYNGYSSLHQEGAGGGWAPEAATAGAAGAGAGAYYESGSSSGAGVSRGPSGGSDFASSSEGGVMSAAAAKREEAQRERNRLRTASGGMNEEEEEEIPQRGENLVVHRTFCSVPLLVVGLMLIGRCIL